MIPELILWIEKKFYNVLLVNLLICIFTNWGGNINRNLFFALIFFFLLVLDQSGWFLISSFCFFRTRRLVHQTGKPLVRSWKLWLEILNPNFKVLEINWHVKWWFLNVKVFGVGPEFLYKGDQYKKNHDLGKLFKFYMLGIYKNFNI